MKTSYIIANRTDVGRVREVNEDCMVTFDSPNGRVIVVCDGMGGQAAGDVASRLACDIITDIVTNNTFGTPTEAITRACMAANQGIVHTAAQNPDLEGMGATCVMVIIKDDLVYYGWVGDSRIYYISNGSIRQLSRDQSFVQQLVDQGQLTAAEAESHPNKNQILNALGLPSMTPPELCPAPLSPEAGSVILLCSDGLSGMVDNQTMASIVSNPEKTLQQKADALVDQACANGGTDNITVQMVQFGSAKGAGKAKKNPFMLYCAAAIIIALIAFAAFFFLSNNKPKEESSKEPSTPTQNYTPNPGKGHPEAPQTQPNTDGNRNNQKNVTPPKAKKKGKGSDLPGVGKGKTGGTTSEEMIKRQGGQNDTPPTGFSNNSVDLSNKGKGDSELEDL